MVSLSTVLREWGRIGILGFGGPPAHIRLLRQLTVERRGWVSAEEFEDAVATCNLLPGPSSTQMSIYTAWRVAGTPGALVGGTAFIAPGGSSSIAAPMLRWQSSSTDRNMTTGRSRRGRSMRGRPPSKRLSER